MIPFPKPETSRLRAYQSPMSSAAKPSAESNPYSPAAQSDNPVRRGIYYGWWMVPVAMMAQVATSPGQTFGLSMFNTFLQNDLAISETALAGAYLLGTLLASFAVPFFGGLMDRYGIRPIMALVVFLFGAACIWSSQVSGLVSLFFAFLFLRMLGQGALTLLAQNMLAMWFRRKLGSVTGVSSMAMAGAMALAPMGILLLIQSVGWRWAFVVLGLLVWGSMLPLLATIVRNRPEEVGQTMDGLAPEPIQPGGSEHHGPQFSLPEAMRTHTYWIFVVMATLWAMIATAITFQINPLFLSHGLAKSDGAATFITMAISMSLMQIVGGWLADRFPLNRLLFVGTGCLALGTGLLLVMYDVWLAHTYAFVFGGGMGLSHTVANTAWPRYFGQAHLGKIRGSIMFVVVAGSSIGPSIMGWCNQLLGSYDVSLAVFALLFTGLSGLMLFATAPGEESEF